MGQRPPLLFFVIVASLCCAVVGAQGEQTPAAAPEFTEEFLNDAEHQAVGQQIWQQQCQHCHGRSAYPGKGPKLKPRRYEPAFVYDRITNGFGKMPAWKDVYSQQERMGIVAYILSKDFSP